MLRAAIVGLRHPHVGTADLSKPAGYIHTFKRLEGVEVVAYCEDADSRSLDLVRRFDPCAHCYSTVDDLIAAEDFDLACVVLPAHEVPETGIKLAEAGKHFFMEKQFARTTSELAELARAVRRNRMKVLAGYPWRFHPIAQELKGLIRQGVLGKPLSIESRLVTTQVRPGARAPDHFLYQSHSEGGGILHMLGGHWLDVMRFLMGCEVKAVQAMIGRPVGAIQEPLEDVAIAALEWENGAFGSIHTGYLQPPIASGMDDCLIYRGLDGWASWLPSGPPRLDVNSGVAAWSGAPERAFHYGLAPHAGYGGYQWVFDIMQRFVEDIRADRDPAVTVDDALHVLQLIEAAYESARTGRRIEVAYGVAEHAPTEAARDSTRRTRRALR